MTIMNPGPDTAPKRYVPISELVRRSSLSRATIYNLIGSGDLPKPVRLSANRVGFPDEVVERFLASKLEAA